MKIQNREWRAVSGSSKLRALDVAIICASALFWSWLTLAVLWPTFYFQLEEHIDLRVFTGISLGSGTLVFAFCAAQPKRATKLLDSRRFEIASVTMATLGGGLALGGSLASFVAPAIVGAVVTGIAFPYFMLEWCRMYSRSGARTAAPLISGALALSIPLDFAASALEPLMRGIVVAPLPILIVAVLALVQALVVHSDQGGLTPATLASGTALGAADLLISETIIERPPERARKPLTVFDAPVVLTASGLCSGFVFGVLVGSESLVGQAWYLPLLFCFVAMLICFAFACVMPLNIRPLIDVLQVVGIAGALALVQLAGAGGSLHDVFVAATFVGFSSFLVAFWTLNSYFATGIKRQIVPLFSLNLAVLCASALAGVIFQCAVLDGSQDGTWRAVMAFLLVLAATMLSASGSLPINVFKVDSAAADVDAPSHTAYYEGIAREIATSHNLTERETEILGLLVSGRSRPRIAEILCVSENTVNSHIQHIYRKLDIHSFQELLDFIYQSDSQ